MFMEELIEKIAAQDYILSGQDRKFIVSINRRVAKRQALTSKQGWVVLKLFRDTPLYPYLGMGKDAYYAYLDDPSWRIPHVASIELKSEARYLGDNCLGFRTSQSSKLANDFKRMGAIYSHGMQIVRIANRKKLDLVIEFIGKNRFHLDAPAEEYLAECLRVTGYPSSVVIDNDRMIFDVPDNNFFAEYVRHVLGADFL